MYCANCRCDYVNWRGRCPKCRGQLSDEPLPKIWGSGPTMPYASLVELVEDSGRQLSIELDCLEVCRERKWVFPYFGHGYAWTKRMQGGYKELEVQLRTEEVGRARKTRFPYMGYGFAWEATMLGNISGNPVSLTASKVQREMKRSFPYKAHGLAWTEKMSGECGDRLKLELQTSEVVKRRAWRFPYFGFGYAWISKAELILAVVEDIETESSQHVFV